MRKNLFAILLLLGVVAVVTFVTFKPVLQHPNSYLFSHGGDAVKSYYNFSYHLKYGEGFKHKGINYPYGEHLQYINSHPFHTAILKQVNKVVNLSDYGVAILNLSMILSLLLAAPFIFLILRRFKLPIWYALIVSLIILFLSPQLDRIKGHFEMVYLFFIPMYWYLLLRYREGKKPWLWGILLVSSGLIGGFTSAYFVALYAIFLFSVLLADLWNKRKNLKEYLIPGLVLLGMAISPLIMVKGLVSLTDWAVDRPYNPWGFYVFHANPFSVFLAPNSALKSIFGNLINMNYQWEGRAYVGLPAALTAVSLVFIIAYRLITHKSIRWFFSNTILNSFLIGATLVLLFSMCFPFKWGFGFILDILPPVKQFRALGRFAWIFYYVFTVYVAYLIYQFYIVLKNKGLTIFALLFLFFALGFWSLDAGINAKKSFKGIFLVNDKLESSDVPYQHMLQEAKINVEDYQAILFLPFANTSGDKLLFEQGMNAFSEAMKTSYHTQLPLIQSFSPRLPFTNALSTIQLLADTTIRKTRLDDMNSKPLLLVMTNEKMSKEELWLKQHSKILHRYNNVSLAEVDLNIFHQSYSNWTAFADSIKTTLAGSKTLKADVDLSLIFNKKFDEFEAENIFHGKGALFQRRNKVEIFNENFFEKGFGGEYELSFWMFFDTRMYDMPQAKLHLYKTNGEYVKTIRLNNRHIHNIYENWVRVDQKLTIEEGLVYQLEMEGKYITIDDLLLKPVNSNVWNRYPDGTEQLNNFPL